MAKTPDMMDGVPRGRGSEDRGRVAEAYFAMPGEIIASNALRFNPKGNPEGKLFLGVVNGPWSMAAFSATDDRTVGLTAAYRSGWPTTGTR